MSNPSLSDRSVVASIVTWNHGHCVQACLESLLRQTYPNVTIIVYDNASLDNTRDLLENFRHCVHVIHNPENKGFCGGHNTVISRTKDDFVLLVNPDVILEPDYIENAVKRLETAPEIGTVCGLLLQNAPGEDCLIDGTGLSVARNRRFLLRHHGVALGSVPLQTTEVFGCDGALPLYRREMIEAISQNGQFFDEMFFAHKEDHDVSWRAQLYGWKTVFDPACVAVHPRVFRPGNLQVRKKLSPEIKFHAVKNDLILLLKNEDAINFWKDFFYIVPRRIGILLYSLIREPHSLKAYWFVLKHLPEIWRRRKVIQSDRKISPTAIRRQFKLGS